MALAYVWQGSDIVSLTLLILCPLIGLVTAALYFMQVRQTEIDPVKDESLNSKTSQELVDIVDAISEGAYSFLFREYLYMFVFVVLFSGVIVVLVGSSTGRWVDGCFTMLSFVFGAFTSIVAGFIGMAVAVFANGRTAIRAAEGLHEGFTTAFKAGAVMGFSLVALGVLVLVILLEILSAHYDFPATPERMFEAAAGYGLGGSSIAMFGRVGGGIYTKAADVGADLVGKVEAGIPEDDPRNPAVIADNVGDNVGDVAGMGADLFGSFAEATCAAMVLSTKISSERLTWSFILFPVLITATGICVSVATSLFAIRVRLSYEKDVEKALKMQLIISTVLMTLTIFLLAGTILPGSFSFEGFSGTVRWWGVAIALCFGLWSGLAIGFVTEFYTSNSYSPVRDVADACRSGAATNIIYGLALGYKSVIIPVVCLCITIFANHRLCGMYGIAMGALGMLSTMSIGLAVDGFGPVSDNAG